MTDVRRFFEHSKAFAEEDANIIRGFYYGKTPQYPSDKDYVDRISREQQLNWFARTSDTEWKERFTEIDSRLTLYANLFKIHDHGEYPFNRKTILIDVMLDKAQREVQKRSRKYFVPGVALLILCIATLLTFIGYLNFGDAVTCWAVTKSDWFNLKISATPSELEYAFVSSCYKVSIANWHEFVLTLVKRIVIGGAILAIAYVFFSLSNACFRESTRLLHRRHSIRFIRLLLYKAEGDLDDKILKDAFGIDDVTTSGFDNIKTDAVLNNLIGRLIDRLGNAKGPGPEDKADKT